MTDTGPILKLDVVNECLRAIGQTPLDDIANVGNSVDAQDAYDKLILTNKLVQMPVRHFNVEKNFTLSPDVDGYIWLPDNTISVDSVKSSKSVDVTMWHNKLYDRVNHTDVFTDDVVVDLQLCIDFNDLPPMARYYVMVRTVRAFVKNKTGNADAARLTEDDEVRAKIDFEEEDSRNDDRTMAQASPFIARMRRGQR